MPRNEIRLQAGILQPEHLAKVRAACRDARELALVEVLFVTRRFEAASLRWQDVNMETGMALIQRGKGGVAAWTLLLATTRDALHRWWRDAGQPDGAAWVFPVPGSGQPGRRYTAGGLGRVVQGLLERAGCWSPGLGCAHRFRRSFATGYMQANPGDLAGLSKLMRHRSITTTARYIYLQPADLAPRLARVNL